MSTVYKGSRTTWGARVVKCRGVEEGTLLELRHDLRNHSPTGAEWGYGGSGPAQLALGLLADACGDAAALVLYQDFKFGVVARLPEEAWELRERDIQDWVQAKLQAEPALEQRLNEVREDLFHAARERGRGDRPCCS